MYIGQHTTSNLDDGYMGSGKIIKPAIKKYGKENFRKEWLMFCEDEEELNYMERVYVDQTWIDRSDTYNLCVGGGVGNGHRGKPAWNRDVSPSKETRQKISQACKGRKPTEEQKRKMSARMSGENNPMYGVRSPMFGKTSAMKGKHHSIETKCKMAKRMSGDKNPFYGKQHSEAKKKKWSEMKKGKPLNLTVDGRLKLSIACMNKNKNRHWFTNGTRNIFTYECPEGFRKGMIHFNKMEEIS